MKRWMSCSLLLVLIAVQACAGTGSTAATTRFAIGRRQEEEPEEHGSRSRTRCTR